MQTWPTSYQTSATPLVYTSLNCSAGTFAEYKADAVANPANSGLKSSFCSPSQLG
jgi:hypothetical protein